jgi:hypothetical protein
LHCWCSHNMVWDNFTASLISDSTECRLPALNSGIYNISFVMILFFLVPQKQFCSFLQRKMSHIKNNTHSRAHLFFCFGGTTVSYRWVGYITVIPQADILTTIYYAITIWAKPMSRCFMWGTTHASYPTIQSFSRETLCYNSLLTLSTVQWEQQEYSLVKNSPHQRTVSQNMLCIIISTDQTTGVLLITLKNGSCGNWLQPSSRTTQQQLNKNHLLI